MITRHRLQHVFFRGCRDPANFGYRLRFIDAQGDHVAATRLTFYREIDEGEVPSAAGHLQLCPDGPDVARPRLHSAEFRAEMSGQFFRSLRDAPKNI